MPSDDQDALPNSVATWVASLFDEFCDPEVLEVVLRPGVPAMTVECRGAAGPLRRLTIPSLFVSAVFAKLKKLASLDVADRLHRQSGRVRLLNFHGSPADFEVTTEQVGKGETITLRRG
jgi:type II secretory ATPase GspE/PulE/Tfp pilus assembly ATPase PilB-like protein